MTTRVTVTTHHDGTLAVTKQSLQGDRLDRRAEAAWLVAAASPVVVPLIDFVDPDPDTGTGATIVTAHSGTATMRTASPPPRLAAALLAEICAGLASLHDRDLVHGKLTLDHIVLDGSGSDGAAIGGSVSDRPTARLCSPAGGASDPTLDLIGLRDAVAALLRSWEERSTPIPDIAAWASLVDQLETPETGFTIRRAGRAFEQLASSASDPASESTASTDGPNDTSRRPWRVGPEAMGWPGLAVATVAVGLLVAGLAGAWVFVSPLGGSAANGTQGEDVFVDVEGLRYRISDGDDIALGRPSGCDQGPAVFYLDTSEATVWAFEHPDREPVGLATVPGATALEIRGEGCGELWAVGPAGETAVMPE